MPELPEIKRFSYIINTHGRGKTFKAPSVIPLPWTGLRIHAIARGKELRLTLWPDTNPSNKIWLLVTHGLVGRWRWAPSPVTDTKGVQLAFPAADGSGELQFVDVQKMGKWNLLTEERWGKDRGADPVDEFELFKKNILDNRSKGAFSQPIGALMLDQKYFNGIGNYLRAEVRTHDDCPPRSLFTPTASLDPVSRWRIAAHVGVRGVPERGEPREDTAALQADPHGSASARPE